ncbi:MAG: AAA family ATPase [Deltaproteobacteria bacterium]|nr:AAA family ATPase [Deltaproteobacteria bacterium]|tara:strand:- start:496 stop:1524 length:1029 start_codon:yes stop_codon:yes gene_type:complete
MTAETRPEATLSPEEIEEKVRAFQRSIGTLKEEIGRVIVGQSEVVEGVILALLAKGHVLLEGVPGLGKTRLVRTLAEALELDFARVQFTPDLMPSDITGTRTAVQDARGQTVLDFQRGPLFTNVVLADEVNRATPRTQSAMLEAMAERSVTISGTTHELPDPFFVLATQNPLEMDGTYPLPEAQLDRFLFKLHVESPTPEELHTILDRTTGREEPRVQSALSRDELLSLRALVRDVPTPRHVQEVVVQLIEATHPDREAAPEATRRYVRFGASPRGAQAILGAAKVRAITRGRFSVATEDVRAVLKPALRHRLIRGFEGEAEGVTTDVILDAILDHVGEGAR